MPVEKRNPALQMMPIMQAVQAPVNQSVSDQLLARIRNAELQGIQEQRQGIELTKARLGELAGQPERKDLSALFAIGDILGGTGGQYTQLYQLMKPKDTKREETQLRQLLAGQQKGLAQSELALLKEQFKQVDSKNAMPALSKGEEAVDKAFGKEYADYIAGGGFADVQKGVEQLKEASKALGESDDLTGPYVSLVPDFLRRRAAEKSMSIQQGVEEVVQRNLRLVLGAQFTEKEGERLISRAFDPSLSEKENKKRVDRLLNQIEKAANAKQKAAEYFEKHGTLKGFKGTLMTMQDFSNLKFDEKGGNKTKNAAPPKYKSKRAMELYKELGQ